MSLIKRASIAIVPFVFLMASGAAEEKRPLEQEKEFRETALPFLKTYCIRCHGPEKQSAKLRLDKLRGESAVRKDELALWTSVVEQIETAKMPPPKAMQPKPEEMERVLRALRAALRAAGAEAANADAMAYPSKGNVVPHDRLFNQPGKAAPYTPARIWRLSPHAYREFMDELTGGRLIEQGGPAVLAKKNPLVVTPFGLTTDPGFRDYAFRYKISGSETQQMALNARVVLNALMTKKTRYQPPRVLTAIAESDGAPSKEQIDGAIKYFFGLLLYREPSSEELADVSKYLTARLRLSGNREGLLQGLVPVFLHPEAVFRSEFGQGKPDEHGRVLLAPLEMAVALSYALTDRRPDAALLAAARNGKLATREDVQREAKRLLDDANVAKPRILRFFNEYFEYNRAPEVFKDPHDLKEAGINGRYEAASLVHDTDLLVLHVLQQDRDVLRQLLTTTDTFVDHREVGNWVKFKDRREKTAAAKGQTAPTHPFGTKPGQNETHKHYNFDPARWSIQMPLKLPSEQRAGILTQPSWLIAHSANTENHAIHRGKWIRERLLGGHIPDTPITVEAKLPDEPKETLRHRMRVTREAYCYTCHVNMDPLGLPFEMYDHLGQFRANELGKPVDATGEVIASGEARLDGKVSNALELIRKLADSERVHQVFVRHAYRYWMGRNETLDDASVLQAAYRAYRDSNGSMKALVLSLLTSDSFLYRK